MHTGKTRPPLAPSHLPGIPLLRVIFHFPQNCLHPTPPRNPEIEFTTPPPTLPSPSFGFKFSHFPPLIRPVSCILQPPIMRNSTPRLLLLTGALLLLLSHPARALTIIPTFDSTVTSSTDASEIESAFNYAAQQIESNFTNPISINIAVTSSTQTGILGTAHSQFLSQGPTVGYTYAQVKSALPSFDNLPSTNPTDGNFAICNAEAKALGYLSSTGTENDGTFTFGTTYSYTFNPADRSVSGETDFIGVAEHEISEIMGRSYILGQPLFGASNGSFYDPFDLFRFTALNTRSPHPLRFKRLLLPKQRRHRPR